MNPLQFLYDTVDILKDGKTGKVYFVYDKVSKQPYILKERALKTAEIYSRLKEIKSPYLPEIYHAVEYDGKLFIVEEFIQGQTLYDMKKFRHVKNTNLQKLNGLKYTFLKLKTFQRRYLRQFLKLKHLTTKTPPTRA